MATRSGREDVAGRVGETGAGLCDTEIFLF